MRIAIYSTLIIFAIATVLQIVFDEVINKGRKDLDKASLCKTWYFFTANIVNMLATVFFIWIGWRVNRSV